MFSKFWHGARNPDEVVCDSQIFWTKKFLPPKMGQKEGFLNLLKNFGIVLNFFYNENLQYLLCFYRNSIFQKILVLEIWVTMFSASQIAELFNQPYLQKKSIKQPGFLHIDTNSHKLKVDQTLFGWVWSEVGVSSHGHGTLKLTAFQE